ncbi:hypothetical protein [uncultured Winogradskyella sp.]|uniref:DUF7672 family protein n=1 Tax=uncultured Winogradskyella sp. TaxID=395353 RepID=UPI002638370F|nr:hypothetical protein [uncultured Winogradskyella sp.]
MLRIYIIGLTILIIAIVANAIIVKLGVNSWYDFINLLTNEGADAFKLISLVNYLWLFIGYPLVLGCGYLIGDKLHYAIFG